MADFSIISDVSDTLIRLMRDSLCPEPVQSPESIKLASPADKNADFQLGLFLYDIREYGEYRSSAPVRRTDNTRTPPPKPLALFYLLFLNSKAQIAAGAEAEQRILGRGLQALTDNPFIRVARSALPDSPPEEPASITFLTLSFDDKSKIWSALTMPYQVGVYFSVSPVLLSSRRSESVVRVTDADFTLGFCEPHGEAPKNEGGLR